MAVHDTEPLPAPPYSPVMLADLHADALPDEVSRQLWPLVRRDPDAMAVMDALDAVTSRLGRTGESLDHGIPVPPDVVERIDRALAAEPAPSASETAPLAAETAPSEAEHARVVAFAPRRRPRALPVTIAVAAAAALIAVAAAVVVPGLSDSTDDPTVVAEPSLVLDPDGVDSDVALSIIGEQNAGSLTDPTRLSECLQANGFSPSTPVLGSSTVRVDRRDGTLLVLPGATPPQLVALAVGDRCGVGDADTLARRDLG